MEMSVSHFDTAIVVDRSSVARSMLSGHLRNYCDRVLAVSSVRELREHLGANVSLVVIDSTAEGAMDWFEEWSKKPERPAVLVVTHLPSRREEIHATLLGAIGYLTKPITYDQIARALAPTT
jgi:DNA-binding response OmpR family regulator